MTVLKDDSRDDISLISSEDKDHQAGHQPPSPSSGHCSTPSVPPSPLSSDTGSDFSGDEYSNLSSHGGHLDPPSPDEEVHHDVDGIPLSERTLFHENY
jgi:hypothetical protein